jgi:DNA-binding response OmpR family regulator
LVRELRACIKTNAMKGKILIVDDEEDVRIFLKYNLEKEGYTVLTASNGREGLEAIRENEIDLVIADVMMPELNGISMFKEMKSITEKNIPVIFLSASTDELHYLSAILAGCHDYLSKPVSLTLLKQKLSESIFGPKQNETEIKT